MQEPTRLNFGEGRCRWSSMSESGSIGPAGVMATACRHRRPNATREAPAVIAVGDQLATRERQAGPCGVAEKPVVPTKPGNSGGGKGLQLKANARSNKDGEIGDEPNNSNKRSEVADGATRKSEGIARLSFLCTVRQGVPRGCADVRLRLLPSQRRSRGSGGAELRGHRGVWGEAMVGRTDARAEKSKLSTEACAAGVYTQAGWEAEAVGDTRHPR